ncbi:MAG: hypothetical protein IAF38_14730 [Bacteroidia bacterium]|nr:hypothetical protein [Bacteroidia bacterium]
MKNALLILLISISTFIAKSQTTTKNSMDFWVGTWDAYWSDSLKGTNTITKILKSNVVEENFVFNDKSFIGRSWSVYDSSSKTWNQTWVDDAGAYLLFAGGAEGDKVILNQTNEKINRGKATSMRMVFYNIAKDSFDWDWQSSKDEINWKSEWLIHYKRKKAK